MPFAMLQCLPPKCRYFLLPNVGVWIFVPRLKYIRISHLIHAPMIKTDGTYWVFAWQGPLRELE